MNSHSQTLSEQPTPQHNHARYDRFGNRWQQNSPAGNIYTSSFTFTGNNSTNTNRMDPGTVGYSYDSAGNLLYDGSHHYFYDAENHLIQVDGTLPYCTSNGASGTAATACYYYDADGRRVFRTGYTNDTCDPDGKRGYVFDLAGHVIVEVNSTSTACIAYLFVGDRQFGRLGGGTFFSHADWLGTVRLINLDTSPTSGAQTCTSLLFGDGLTCNTYNSNVLHFTGKERDFESGLDNFGARYDSSSMGRFMSPDPLMASARVWDPQTWNRYGYARNNPLTLIDPTGMVEVTADQCAKDKHCVTVNVNVIYDKNANDGKGLTDKQKADFQKGQLQNAKDQYGDADIHLNVTYSAGAVTTDNGKIFVSGLQAGALNVVVTDMVSNGGSGMSGKTAISFVNPEATDLAHEMAHQFMGDTQGWRNWLANADPLPAGIFLNAITDFGNDFERAWMRNIDSHSGLFSHYPLASAFNRNADIFQKRIQPTTKPQ